MYRSIFFFSIAIGTKGRNRELMLSVMDMPDLDVFFLSKCILTEICVHILNNNMTQKIKSLHYLLHIVQLKQTFLKKYVSRIFGVRFPAKFYIHIMIMITYLIWCLASYYGRKFSIRSTVKSFI